MQLDKLSFNVSEIFHSIQGEGSRAGMPCVFVRLQGCGLRCSWCDTPYGLKLNKVETILSGQEIIDKVLSYDCDFVEFTGGEPLEQPDVIELMKYFVSKGLIVAVETAGYLTTKDIPKEVIKIIDFKAPGSKMSNKNNYENFNYLNPDDELKFVICDRADYEWSVNLLNEHNLYSKVNTILFSPVFGKLEYVTLANWILEDRLKVRMQIQLHKHIWEPNTRGV